MAMDKLAWRRTWFSVHKWIGLVLAILIIPLSLSGSALVWDKALDKLVNPARYAVTGTTLLAPGAYAAAATARLKPGERVAQLTMPDERGPVVVAAAGVSKGPQRAGPPVRTMIYLDPPTARVLDVASSGAGLIRFVHILHGSLQIPGGWGRTIVGWIGVAMMISAFTGLWLWWPTVGRVSRGLRWGRHRNLDTNLHQTFGFWIALPLFVLSLTGAWISFPSFTAALSGQKAQRGGPDRMAPMRARPVAATTLPVATAIERARAVVNGEVRSVTWPTEKKPDWNVQIASGHGRPATVAVADDGGVAVLAPAAGAGGQSRLMRGIHEGSIGGPVWQVIVFIGGLIPAMLAVTGIIMWWRARGWKAQLRRKQRVRAVPAE